MAASEPAFLAGVNVSAAYVWWPVFRCPSMAGFECPPRLRPIGDVTSQDRLRELILEAYAEYEERAAVA